MKTRIVRTRIWRKTACWGWKLWKIYILLHFWEIKGLFYAFKTKSPSQTFSLLLSFKTEKFVNEMTAVLSWNQSNLFEINTSLTDCCITSKNKKPLQHFKNQQNTSVTRWLDVIIRNKLMHEIISPLATI